ncbi:DUF2974 domain-containing protein [Streptococcus cameli]
MPNLLDYLIETQYDSFYDIEPSVLDILALTELTYLPFDNMVPLASQLENTIRLQELIQVFFTTFQGKYPPLSMVIPERLRLLEQISQSKRFKICKALAYVNETNIDLQKQFAAMTFQLRPNEYLVVFRGTDDTIIGWKEDFHMTYLPQVPAQEAASKYLTHILEQLPGNIKVAGHSKGGNLAMYASASLPTHLQNRIEAVYSFDAPGLHKTVIASKGFQTIQERIQSYIPQDSIVGMMLENPIPATIVKSKARGLIQHLTFTWETQGNLFKTVSTVTNDSLQIEQTLKTWTASLPHDELKEFFDLFFGLFLEAGITKFSDITIDTPQKWQKLKENRQNLTPNQKAMLDRAFHLLVDTRIQIWKENLANQTSSIQLPTKSALLQELSKNFDNINMKFHPTSSENWSSIIERFKKTKKP